MNKNRSKHELGIGAVARRTGLSQHLIRIWERRYGAVAPSRTETRRRLYSEEDAVRLMLLGRAVRAGHRIGDIARFSMAKLERLVSGAPDAGVPDADVPVPAGVAGATDHIQQALEAIMNLNGGVLEEVLSRADIELGQARSLDQVIMPLMERIGSMWKDGEMRIAHEHMATAVVTHHVGSVLSRFRYPAQAPVLIVATPVGQLHEAGALAVAMMAALEGWRPLYIGPNLPADEIAGAALQAQARAVALSLVFPADDPKLPAELAHLRRCLPTDIEILVGGRAASAYRIIADAGQVMYIDNLAELRSRLDRLRGGKAVR